MKISQLTDHERFERFKQTRRNPTSMFYHPDAELIEEAQFIKNLHQFYPRLHKLLMQALDRNTPNALLNGEDPFA